MDLGHEDEWINGKIVQSLPPFPFPFRIKYLFSPLINRCLTIEEGLCEGRLTASLKTGSTSKLEVNFV